MRTIFLSLVLLLSGQLVSSTPECTNSLKNQLNFFKNFKSNDLYADLTIDEFLSINGYSLESYNVTTEDGYILTLHRVKQNTDNDNNNSKTLSKPVVVFKHGFQSSSWDFLYLGKNNALAMLLSDLGYDIWLINSRGNRYSMNHVKYNSSYNSKEFWNFSFHEKGYYDLPACIDFIINKTNKNNVTLIGYSEGTMESLVLMSEKPEYQNKFNLVILLAPAPYLSHHKSILFQKIHKFQKEIQKITNLLHFEGLPYNFLSSNRDVLKHICSNNSPFQDLCLIALYETFYGPNYEQFNKTYLSFFMTNYPAGNSMKELYHFVQGIDTGEFKRYDYGTDNLIYYGNPKPPKYDISSIKTPIAVYYAKNDICVTIEDVEIFLKEVPNLVESHLIKSDLFNHIDFIWNNDAKNVLNKHVIKIIQKFN